MPIFYRKAIEAAIHPARADWLTEAHLMDWNGLAAALGRLTPEQRCDAIYLDWLLQLNSPAGPALLQVRNHLIGDGGLAANYLAELAQNANDAYDEEPENENGAQVRIVLDGNWLFVSNNGRKITPLNLLGLSRFFVHAAGEIVELNERTIGRFGIGFKSCYRIASSVFVHTWDAAGQFGFRLPICREGDDASRYDPERFNQLIQRLQAVGETALDRNRANLNWLGYCTPEFLSDLPRDLAERTNSLRETRGTLFCFRIRPEKLADVQSRISGQAHEVYELCPLFLPKVRLVQLGRHVLRMKEKRFDASNSLPGQVTAVKVELTTESEGERPSNSRFWKLREPGESPRWQIALHADGEHRLKLDKEHDERGATLKDGAAYAFFPLNAVNWSFFRFHLHLMAPTNFQRDNWNTEDASVVTHLIQKAIAGMTAWLEAKLDHLAHGDWGMERLVVGRPSPPLTEGDWPAKWVNLVYDELLRAVEEYPLLRSVFGGRVRKSEALCVEIVANQAAKEAWSQLASAQDLNCVLPAFVSSEAAVFAVSAARPDEIGEPFGTILRSQTVSVVTRQAALLAYLSTNSHSSGSLERTLASALIERANGQPAKLGDLMSEPCGTELLPEWHACFERLKEWGRTAVWQSAHVCAGRLPDHFRKLSKSTFNPPWAEVSTRLNTLEAWQTHGAQFWANPRRACPPQHLADVLAILRVPSGDGRWLPVSGLWLDDASADCFAGLLIAWPLPYMDAERQRITALLNAWGLFAEWEKSTEKLLTEKLPGELTRRLTEYSSEDAFTKIFNTTFEAARRLLDHRWAHILNEAERTSVSRFVHERTKDSNLSGKTVLSASIAATACSALCLNDGFASAPLWLTDVAYQRICRLGLQETLGFKFLNQIEFTQQRAMLVRGMLEQFHRWKDSIPTPAALNSLNEMAAVASRTDRRNWPVSFSPQNKKLLKELIHTSVEQDGNPAEQLNRLLLDKVENWRSAERLPALLAKVPSLAEACVQPNSLKLEIPAVTLTPIERSQILPAALEEPRVRALVEAGGHRFFRTSQELKLQWFQDGDKVATLPSAEFAVDGDKLIFADSLPPAELEPYRNILRAYKDNHLVSPEYQHDEESGISAYALFQKHRPEISKVLVESRVRAFGYEEKHILRELLQNAESAYASKREAALPAEPWFECQIAKIQASDKYQVTVTHAGRAFDEPDKHGNPRFDVDRIVMESAPIQNTEDEIGRFNRGFKSVFCAARDKRVRIESGGFDFVVQDLMLRFPPKPERNAARAYPVTKFTFECSRDEACALLSLKEPPRANAALDLINASTLVFLRYICRVTIRFGERTWEWKTTPSRRDGWCQVLIDPGGGSSSEKFQVYHSPRTQHGSSFAAAMRLDAKGLPRRLESGWQTLRLTFETDEPFKLDVLINGQFEAEPGRRALLNVKQSGLVDEALNVVVQKCFDDLSGNGLTEERWLAWARCLDLKHKMAGLVDRAANAEGIACQVADFLTHNIPHAGSRKSLDELQFASDLMHNLLLHGYCRRWNIESNDWIASEIAEHLPDARRDEVGLHDWLRGVRLDHAQLQSIQNDISSRQFRQIADKFPDEMAKVRQQLQLRLRPARQLQTEKWDAADLFNRWKDDEKANRALLEEYTLDGANWCLLYPGDTTHRPERKDKLRTDLSCPHSDEGRRVWYRLLGLACLMSAAWGRMTAMRTFWQDTLEMADFWNRTANNEQGFAEATRELFSNLVLRSHPNVKASGEGAEYWRHVFYDVRKVHELIWQYKFAETIWSLVSNTEHAAQLPMFLRGGVLSGQAPWAGVLGQSAGAPVFFVVRELCRLGIVPPPALARLKPLAFFACTPVRRAAVRIGWIDSMLGVRKDFESLAKVSELLHAKIQNDASLDATSRDQLLDLYDIPLLHLGLEG